VNLCGSACEEHMGIEFCVSFSFAMIALNDWREQPKVQVRIHPSWIGVE